MNIEGWNSGSEPLPDICEHIKNIFNQLIINGCTINTTEQPIEIRCDKCRKVLGGKYVYP